MAEHNRQNCQYRLWLQSTKSLFRCQPINHMGRLFACISSLSSSFSIKIYILPSQHLLATILCSHTSAGNDVKLTGVKNNDNYALFHLRNLLQFTRDGPLSISRQTSIHFKTLYHLAFLFYFPNLILWIIGYLLWANESTKVTWIFSLLLWTPKFP